MKSIPPDIAARFDFALNKFGLARASHYHYKKWLRYYLDFCFKYNHDPTIRESVLPFIQKLKAKRQSRHQLAQATKAIELYLEIDGHLEEHDKQLLLNTKTFDVSIKKTEVKEANADWRPVYNGLESEIKLRHYSPRTLEAYRTWARHLQGFTKSKDPSLLSSHDVKDFLTHLAVKRKVSASSQNQASLNRPM